jgi:hypothetical protein
MLCKRCPHHVRHGKVAADGKSIEFQDRCGLKMKSSIDQVCQHFPFPKVFDYIECDVYKATFKSTGIKNDVVPTSDFLYSDSFHSQPITDMELL